MSLRMAINVYNFVQYNGGFLSDIFLLTQAPTVFLYGSNTLIILSSRITTTLLTMYYNNSKLPPVLLCLEALHSD